MFIHQGLLRAALRKQCEEMFVPLKNWNSLAKARPKGTPSASCNCPAPGLLAGTDFSSAKAKGHSAKQQGLGQTPAPPRDEFSGLCPFCRGHPKDSDMNHTHVLHLVSIFFA